MNTNVQILPGIRFIGFFDLDKTQNLCFDLSAVCGMPVPVFTDITEIKFFGSPECKKTTEKANGQYSDSVSLKFSSYVIIPSSILHPGFIVTDIEGRSFVIGCQKPPYPNVKREYSSGSPSSNPAGLEYEVTHTALKSLIPCTI